MKRFFICFILIVGFLPSALAKEPSKIWQEFEKIYVPADYHYALVSAHENLDPQKLRGFVVVMKDGIPAERAPFYISWGDYDYRGVTINGEKVTTRTGSAYAHLKAGDVMAISDIDHLGKTLYMKLISPEIYIPKDKAEKKRHSRVTNQILFKVPKDVFKQDDAPKAVELLGEWFKPFQNINDAKVYVDKSLRGPKGAVAIP